MSPPQVRLLFILAAGMLMSCAHGPAEIPPLLPPTIEAVSPAEGETVRGVVTIEVEAANTDSVSFAVDDTTRGTRTSPPWRFSWNTRVHANGVHLLCVTAYGRGETQEHTWSPMVDNTVIDSTVTVAVTPAQSEVPTGGSRQLSATVTGTNNPCVLWEMVEGEDWGRVSQDGRYLAPLVLPDPPVATVRAVSWADPTATGEAVIDLRESMNAALADEIRELFYIGYAMADTSDLAVGRVVDLLYRSHQLNGGEAALTGTITRTGTTYAYLPDEDPPGTLAYRPDNGDPWWVEIDEFSGNLHEWEAFLFMGPPRGYHFQGRLACTLTLPGRMVVAIDHLSDRDPLTGAYAAAPSPLNVVDEAYFSRTLTGSILFRGETWAVDIQHEGYNRFGALRATEEAVLGSLTHGGETLEFDEEYSFYSGGGAETPWTGDWAWAKNNLSRGGDRRSSFLDVQFTGEVECGYYGICKGSDIWRWVCTGSFEDDGPAPYLVRYAEYTPTGYWGPPIVLDMGDEGAIELAPPGPPRSWEEF